MQKNFMKIFTIVILFNIANSPSLLFCSSGNFFDKLISKKKRDSITSTVETATGIVANLAADIAKKNLLIPLAKFCDNQLNSEAYSLNDESIDSDSDEELSYNDDDIEIVKEDINDLFYKNQTDLQKDLQVGIDKTVTKLNEAMDNFFTKYPKDWKTQLSIFRTLTLLRESSLNKGKSFSLPSDIASKYNEHQRAILIEKVRDHVDRIEPKIKKQYESDLDKAAEIRDRRIASAHDAHYADIKKAEREYKNTLTKKCTKLKYIASNSLYINSCANNKKEHPAHNPANYENIESYQKFIDEMRHTHSVKVSTDAGEDTETTLQEFTDPNENTEVTKTLAAEIQNQPDRKPKDKSKK